MTQMILSPYQNNQQQQTTQFYGGRQPYYQAPPPVQPVEPAPVDSAQGTVSMEALINLLVVSPALSKATSVDYPKMAADLAAIVKPANPNAQDATDYAAKIFNVVNQHVGTSATVTAAQRQQLLFSILPLLMGGGLGGGGGFGGVLGMILMLKLFTGGSTTGSLF